MNYVVATYACYLVISVALTIWVACTLHKNGRLFLVDAFHGNEPFADSINHLLVVGFYLINAVVVAISNIVMAGVLSSRLPRWGVSPVRTLSLWMLVLNGSGVFFFFGFYHWLHLG